MDKSKPKKPSYNTEAVKALSEKHSFTGYYIRQCINGARKGITPDRIKKEYNELVRPSQKKIEEFKNS